MSDNIGIVSNLVIPNSYTSTDIIEQLQAENEELKNIINEYKRKWNSCTEVSRRLLQLEDYKADVEYDRRIELEKEYEEE